MTHRLAWKIARGQLSPESFKLCLLLCELGSPQSGKHLAHRCSSIWSGIPSCVLLAILPWTTSSCESQPSPFTSLFILLPCYYLLCFPYISSQLSKLSPHPFCYKAVASYGHVCGCTAAYSRAPINCIQMVHNLLHLQWVAELRTSHSAVSYSFYFKGRCFFSQLEIISCPVQLTGEIKVTANCSSGQLFVAGVCILLATWQSLILAGGEGVSTLIIPQVFQVLVYAEMLFLLLLVGNRNSQPQLHGELMKQDFFTWCRKYLGTVTHMPGACSDVLDFQPVGAGSIHLVCWST